MLQAYPKKLEDKLDDFEKGFLKAVDDLHNEVDNMAFSYKDDIDMSDDIQFFKKVKKEISEQIFDYVKTHIKYFRDEHQVAFIESNHYMIDEDGNIIDENEK